MLLINGSLVLPFFDKTYFKKFAGSLLNAFLNNDIFSPGVANAV